MHKASLQDSCCVRDNSKVILNQSQVEQVKRDEFRPRTMSDPLSSKYYRQARKNRYPEAFGCVNQCCKTRVKHTHFANSKQIAQSIYPDFLSSLPSDNSNEELKNKIKKLLTDNEKRNSGEVFDVPASKGPSRKSLLAWYRREYGLSFDESKANIA